jgi:hypothetical protein
MGELRKYELSNLSNDKILEVINLIREVTDSLKVKLEFKLLKNQAKGFKTEEDHGTYRWIDIIRTSRKITKLYNELKKKCLIDTKTELTDFRAIFTEKGKKPINWIGEGGLSEIIYMMYLLFGEKKGTIKYIERPNQPFKNLNFCFTCNGKALNRNSIKTIYSKIKKDTCKKTEHRHLKIYTIVENLKYS